MSDRERLTKLLNHEKRPLQFIFSGKAHPADLPGKALLHDIVELARAEARVTFLEDYDIDVARHLVQGADIWLNNPRRFLEASGTSGMKAAMNGVLNLSVLDGWWPEAYTPEIGWAIPGESDDADRAELYRLLEEEVLPAFYDDRGHWERMMQASVERVTPRFSSHRMVKEYADRYYLPASGE
jgi:starch phosphorylase